MLPGTYGKLVQYIKDKKNLEIVHVLALTCTHTSTYHYNDGF